MIFFVYATIAPLSSVALGLAFFILSFSFRHQFVYIYPKHPDTGGKLFLGFIDFAFICIIVSELTIVGFLGIKKNPVAAALMFPLIVLTVGFMIYIKQKHLKVGDQLPSVLCVVADARNDADESVDYSFLKDAFLHPAMKADLDVQPEAPKQAGTEPPLKEGNSEDTASGDVVPAKSTEAEA